MNRQPSRRLLALAAAAQAPLMKAATGMGFSARIHS